MSTYFIVDLSVLETNISAATSKMIFYLGLISILLSTASGELKPGLEYVCGTFVFKCYKATLAITVHKGGKVSTGNVTGSGTPFQRWTLAHHAEHENPAIFELKQAEVPLNELSGYEPKPGIFPKPIELAYYGKHRPDGAEFHRIKIRGRWCLKHVGEGQPLDLDDLEDGEPSRYELWRLERV